MFEFLWKKNDVIVETDNTQSAGNYKINYDPNMVRKLQDDHVYLLGLFSEIQAVYQARKYERITVNIDKFGKALYGHLLLENAKFYIYLRQKLAVNEDGYAIAINFRLEMNNICRVTMEFIEKYKSIDAIHKLHDQFGIELAKIGKVLTDRMAREENTLYPLYK